MKAKFVWNKATEIERILHTSRQISSGFYIDNKFKILPYLNNKDASCVYLPPIDYSTINNYWIRVAKIPLQIPVDGAAKLKNELNSPADRFIKLTKQIDKLKSDWKQKEKYFWQFLDKNSLTDSIRNVKNIEIRVTNFGTISSWSYLKKDSTCATYYVRSDASSSHIAEAILTQLTYHNGFELGLSWKEIEGIVDYLLTKSSLSKIFSDYSPTLKYITKKDKKHTKASIDYVRKLDIPIFKNKISYRNLRFYIGPEPIDSKLTKSEHAILKILHQNKGFIVTYDDIAEIIWKGNDDKFSLWALNKHFQRLKQKLIILGAKKSCIDAKRGRGYIMN